MGGNLSPTSCGLTRTDCNCSQLGWWRFANNCRLNAGCTDNCTSSPACLFALDNNSADCQLVMFLYKSKVDRCLHHFVIKHNVITICHHYSWPPTSKQPFQKQQVSPQHQVEYGVGSLYKTWFSFIIWFKDKQTNKHFKRERFSIVQK